MLKLHITACLMGTALAAAPAYAQSERTPPVAGAEAFKPAQPDSTTTKKPAPSAGDTNLNKPEPESRADTDATLKPRVADDKKAFEQVQPAPATSRAAVSYITQNRPGLWRASKMDGVDVYNENDEKIGDIAEVLLDKDGKVEAVIIGVGGFLGIGERNVAVPFNALQWRVTEADAANPNMPAATTRDAVPRDRDAVAERRTEKPARTADRKMKDAPERAILAGATKDLLKKAPEFKYAD